MIRLPRKGSAFQVTISPATAPEPPNARRIVHSTAADLGAQCGFHAGITEFVVVQLELGHPDVSAA